MTATDDEITREATSRRRQRVEYGRDAETINAGARSWVLARLWWQSKSDGVALIVHPSLASSGWSNDDRPVPEWYTAEEWQRMKVQGQREENARRDFATLRVCGVVLMGMIEGRDWLARDIGKALGDRRGLVTRLLADDSVPSYTQMRNFLIGEMDAHPVIAMAAAFGQRAMHNRIRASEIQAAWGREEGEPGWL